MGRDRRKKIQPEERKEPRLTVGFQPVRAIWDSYIVSVVQGKVKSRVQTKIGHESGEMRFS